MNRESIFVKTLEEHFAHCDDQSKIDSNMLICWGIALCQGEPKKKAEVWWSLLQDETQTKISAGDKDFMPFFTKMFYVITTLVYEQEAAFSGQEAEKSAVVVE